MRILMLVGLALAFSACSEKSDNAKTEESGNEESGSNDDDPDVDDPDAQTVLAMTGTLAVNVEASHVVAASPAGGNQLAEIDGDAFEIDIEPGQPYTLTFVDSSKSGEGMVSARFVTESMDSVASTAPGSLALGTIALSSESALVTDVAVAKSDKEHADIIEGLGLSSDAAAFWGSVDDSLKRYLNPDIDGDGQLDIDQGVRFILDFHNRFQVKVNGSDVDLNAVKNEFLSDQTELSYTGTGVMLEVEQNYFSSQPSSYSLVLAGEVEAEGTTVAAGEPITKNFDGTSIHGRYQFSIETKNPPNGRYQFSVGDNSFTFGGVEVSDTSGGAGFLAPFIKINTDAENIITGLDWKWMKRTSASAGSSDAKWVPAEEHEVLLVVLEKGAYIDLKVDGANSGKSIGISAGRELTGSTSISQANVNGLDESEKTAIAFSRILENPGISYDDSRGMRFFQSFVDP